MREPIRLKSIYEPSQKEDGSRYFAETFWPEGTEIHDLIPCGWPREIAPSYHLMLTAQCEEWSKDRFHEEYQRELLEPERRARLMQIVCEAKTGPVTLLHRSKKEDRLIRQEDTSVYDLREFLEEEIKKQDESHGPRSRTADANRLADAKLQSSAVSRWKEEGGK